MGCLARVICLQALQLCCWKACPQLVCNDSAPSTELLSAWAVLLPCADAIGFRSSSKHAYAAFASKDRAPDLFKQPQPARQPLAAWLTSATLRTLVMHAKTCLQTKVVPSWPTCRLKPLNIGPAMQSSPASLPRSCCIVDMACSLLSTPQSTLHCSAKSVIFRALK